LRSAENAIRNFPLLIDGGVVYPPPLSKRKLLIVSKPRKSIEY